MSSARAEPIDALDRGVLELVATLNRCAAELAQLRDHDRDARGLAPLHPPAWDA